MDRSCSQLTTAGLAALACCFLTSAPRAAAPAPDRPIISAQAVVATGDIDGDHRADRVYLESGNRASTLRFVLASGVAREAIAVPPDSLTIAALDLDNDHDLDILIVSRSGRLTVLVNHGNGEFWPKELPRAPRVAPASTDSVETIAAATCAATVPPAADGVRILQFGAGRPAHVVTIEVAPGRSPRHSPQHLRGPPSSHA
jgi:hypothetical protein